MQEKASEIIPDLPVAGAPSPWVARFASAAAPTGAALDVACGGGRNLLPFLAAGRRVVALDRDVSGVAGLAGRPDVEIVAADLENGPGRGDGGPFWPFPPDRRFAAVVVVNYLHRPLLPVLAAAVAEGGALIYETFAVGNERFGRPRNPDFLLRPGELPAAAQAAGLTVVAYEHGTLETQGPEGSVVRSVKQRMCAVNGSGLVALNRLFP